MLCSKIGFGGDGGTIITLEVVVCGGNPVSLNKKHYVFDLLKYLDIH